MERLVKKSNGGRGRRVKSAVAVTGCRLWSCEWREPTIKWVFEYGVSLFKPNSFWSCPRNTDLTCGRKKKKNQGQSHQVLSKSKWRKRVCPCHRGKVMWVLFLCVYVLGLQFNLLISIDSCLIVFGWRSVSVTKSMWTTQSLKSRLLTVWNKQRLSSH